MFSLSFRSSFLFGGNGSTSDNCLLVNFLGSLEKNGNSDKNLILLNFLFFKNFWFLQYKKEDFLANSFFYISRPFLLIWCIKNYFKNLKSSFNDFCVYLTILCSLPGYFMIIDGYFMIIDNNWWLLFIINIMIIITIIIYVNNYLWLLIIISDYLWLLMIINDYFIVIDDYIIIIGNWWLFYLNNFIGDYFMITDNYFMIICDYFLIIDNNLWLFVIICDLFK